MKSQNLRVLEQLKRKKVITVDQGLNMGIYRLAARIYELRNDGHDIRTIVIPNEFGNPVAKYMLVKAA